MAGTAMPSLLAPQAAPADGGGLRPSRRLSSRSAKPSPRPCTAGTRTDAPPRTSLANGSGTSAAVSASPAGHRASPTASSPSVTICGRALSPVAQDRDRPVATGVAVTAVPGHDPPAGRGHRRHDRVRDQGWYGWITTAGGRRFRHRHGRGGAARGPTVRKGAFGIGGAAARTGRGRRRSCYI